MAPVEVNDGKQNNGIDLTKSGDGGVIKVIKKEGSVNEKPSAGTKVTVHYTGRLTDGTVFDSSRTRGEKFTFNLGKGQVIKAWDLCVASMKKGEVCEVTCAAKYAYGKRGSPPTIPADATLIFDIELFHWEGEDISEEEDKGVLKEVLEEGSDSTTPNDGASVAIRLIGKYNGSIFDDRDIDYIIGEDNVANLVPAINLAVKTMKSNEQCRLLVKPKYGFGTVGNEAFGIPPNADLEYHVTMLQFERAKESWEMSDSEKIAASIDLKEKGTAQLKVGELAKATKLYKRAVEFVEFLDAKEDGDDDAKATIKKSGSVRLACYLNMALCQNKLKEFAEAIGSCNKALEIDASNEKALYRKGEAYFSELNFDEAKTTFEMAVQVNPGNKSAQVFLLKCKAHLKRQRQKEMDTFKGMFDKFVQQDEKDEIRRKVEVQKERARAKAEKKLNTEKLADESGEGMRPAKEEQAEMGAATNGDHKVAMET